MSITDSFTENDMWYFESIKNILECECNRTLWDVSFNRRTKKYKIKCLNCQKHLTLSDLYALNFKTMAEVNDDGPQSDYHTSSHVGYNIALIQNLFQEIQDLLINGDEKT